MLRYKSNSTQIADLKYFMINTHDMIKVSNF
jgi:hypothetical protein